jgi:putative transposase
MAEYLHGDHTIHDIKYHLVWLTKYRYKILTDKIAERVRELLLQGCKARGLTIIRGAVGKDHIHMLISSPTSLAPSKIAQYLKGRSSKLLQEEFPDLGKRYWGSALVGERLFLRNCWCGNQGNDSRIRRKAV